VIKRIKLKGKAIASRLTGISCPIAGVSWTPPLDEQDKARRLLVFLEDRRVLYNPYEMEIGPHVVDSVLEIRKRLVADLEDVEKDSLLGESMAALSAACRAFLNKTEFSPGHRIYGPFTTALGELRALFGVHLARLVCGYDLEVSEEAASILPPPVEEEDDATTS